MRFSAIIPIVIFFAVHLSQAQPGDYVITLNGDTLRGSILDRDWSVNPKKIQFTSTSGLRSEFAPNEVTGFYISGSNSMYLGSILRIDKSSLRAIDVMNGIDQNVTVLDTVFLRVLVKGELDLYQLNDGKRNHYFVRTKQKPIEELLVQKRRAATQSNGVSGTITINKYRNQLASLMSKCGKVNNSIGSLRFSQDAFVKLFTNYHDCMGVKSSYVDLPDTRFKFSLNMLVGAHSSKLNAMSEVFLTVNSNRYKRSNGPNIGFGAEVTLPKNRGAWGVMNQLFYSSYDTEASTVVPSGLNTYTSTNFVNLQHLKLATTLRYKFLPKSGRYVPFVGFGVSNGFALQKSFYANRITSGFSNVTERIDYEVRGHEQGLVTLAGVNANKIGIELQHEYTNGFSVYSALGTRVRYIRLLVSYRVIN